MFVCPGTYHEVLLEKQVIRGAVLRTILDFFSQSGENVNDIHAPAPLEIYDPTTPLFSISELSFRAIGAGIASMGIVVGFSMLLGTRSSLDKIWGQLFANTNNYC